jgi:hypothetical protein
VWERIGTVTVTVTGDVPAADGMAGLGGDSSGTATGGQVLASCKLQVGTTIYLLLPMVGMSSGCGGGGSPVM